MSSDAKSILGTIKSLEMYICLWPEFECPEVTLCGWQDINIQLLLSLSFHSSFSHSTTASLNLPTHSLNHIIHWLTYKTSQTLGQYTNPSVIIDFGHIHLKFARSVCQSVIPPVSRSVSTTVRLSTKSHFRLFSLSLTYSFGVHSLHVSVGLTMSQSCCTVTQSVY